MTTGEIIKKYREKLGLTQSELGDKFGVQKSVVAKWESGTVKNLKKDTIQGLATLFNITPLELLGYEVEPHTPSSLKTMNRHIPVYGSIPAGTPFEAINDRLEDVEIPSFLDNKKDLFGLKVIGDSMSRVLPDGCIAVIQPTSELNNGEIGAILVNGDDATIKRFYKLSNSIILESDSYNPEHAPIVILESDGISIKIIGKLIWSCTPAGFYK